MLMNNGTIIVLSLFYTLPNALLCEVAYLMMSCGVKSKVSKYEVLLPLRSMIKINFSLVSCPHGYTFLWQATG
jgi:hypothetical protein